MTKIYTNVTGYEISVEIVNAKGEYLRDESVKDEGEITLADNEYVSVITVYNEGDDERPYITEGYNHTHKNEHYAKIYLG